MLKVLTRVKLTKSKYDTKIPQGLSRQGGFLYTELQSMNFSSLKKLTKKQRIKILFFTAGLFGAACLFVIAMNFRGITVTAPAGEEQPEEETVLRDLFTGEAAIDASEGSRVACVMVENSADAWPLSGVEDAFLVIEAPAEGGIPRFMACFTEGTDVEKIGPVRSVRPYYVSWVSAFKGALFAHVGGSPEGLRLLATSKDVVDLDEFWNGSSFWRDSARFAPHNAYTSSALLWAAADRLEIEYAVSPGWTYADSTYQNGDACVPVTISSENASTSYDVSWDCDEGSGDYVRKQGNAGKTAMSSDGNVYRAANVVILEADISVIDEVGRKEIVTEGTGNAILCSTGTCRDVIWHKEGVDKPLQFFTSYPNDPAVFAPGKTWIEVVESVTQVVTGEIN